MAKSLVLTQKQREVLVNSTLESYAIIDGSNIGRSTYNHASLYKLAKTGTMAKKLNEMMLDNIRTVERLWTYTLVVLHNDGEEIYYNFEVGKISNATSVDLNAFISEAMRDFIEEMADGYECSWMWVIAPNDSFNWDRSIESLLDENMRFGLMGDDYKGLGEVAARVRGPIEERETCLLS